jgi:hypothetical protein
LGLLALSVSEENTDFDKKGADEEQQYCVNEDLVVSAKSSTSDVDTNHSLSNCKPLS